MQVNCSGQVNRSAIGVDKETTSAGSVEEQESPSVAALIAVMGVGDVATRSSVCNAGEIVSDVSLQNRHESGHIADLLKAKMVECVLGWRCCRGSSKNLGSAGGLKNKRQAGFNFQKRDLREVPSIQWSHMLERHLTGALKGGRSR